MAIDKSKSTQKPKDRPERRKNAPGGKKRAKPVMGPQGKTEKC